MQDAGGSGQTSVLGATLGRRFHRPFAPSAVACLGSKDPIILSHITSDSAMPAPTLPPPASDAFALHVHHAPLTKTDVWIEDRHRRVPFIPTGGVFIFDLRTTPIAQVNEPFEFSRFQISRATMDDLAYEHGMRRLSDLRAPTVEADPVLQHLALAMLERNAYFGRERDALFSDGIALAFFAHVARKYAGLSHAPRLEGVLAPWQVRRVREWVDAHLNGPVAIVELAGLVNLSRSHFARMFQKSFGMPPHRWLLLRRVERAKQMLKQAIPLAHIASGCGFADQSHFTKVFTQLEGVTPGAWRRQLH